MKAARIAVFSCLFVAYFFVFPYNHGLNNPNENTRIYTAIALVEQHGWAMDAEFARFGPTNDNAKIDGHQYAAKAPALTLLAVPVYWLFSKLAPAFVDRADAAAWLLATTLVLRLLLVQLPCFGFLVWFERRLRTGGVAPELSLLAVAALAVGTNFFAYSLMFVSHSLAGAAAFVAFSLIGERRRPLEAALLLGLVTLFEYQGATLSLVLGLFALTSYAGRRARLAFVAGAAVCAAALLGFQAAVFGSPWRTPFRYLEDQTLVAGHVHGFMGLRLPQPTALWALSFDRTVGLFGTSPFLWLLVPMFALVYRQRQARWAFAMCLVLLVTISGVSNWRGGWSIGPRYLTPIMPFAVFVIALGLQRLRERGPLYADASRALATGLSLASAITIGIVSVVINTLPYDILRPLIEVALPFLRAGFVPYHLGDLLGLHSPALLFPIVGALLLATVVLLFSSLRRLWLRLPMAALACLLGVAPALAKTGDCPRGVRRLSEIWEPQGRDRLQTLRAAAYADPCSWRRLARLEASLCWEGASEDFQRAPYDCR